MSPAGDPESTRQHILDVTTEEMRHRGYKAASLADILNKAGVSKGALYHHFANKQELGYAVFDEIFIAEFLSDWDIPVVKQAYHQHWADFTANKHSLQCQICRCAAVLLCKPKLIIDAGKPRYSLSCGCPLPLLVPFFPDSQQ